VKKWLKSIGLGILVLTLVIHFQSSPSSDQEWKSPQSSCQETMFPKISQSDYIEHSPIHITNNDGFEALDIAGNGTPINPYRIEGYFFNNTDQQWLIEIFNTNVHFIICNNLFIRPFGNITGIDLDHVANGTISNNKIINTSIRIVQSENIEIKNNLMEGYGCSVAHYCRGIWLDGSDNVKIINNTIFGFYYAGINLWESNFNSILNNNISNGRYTAIEGYYSSYNMLINNCLCYNGLDGIDFDIADNNTIKNNLICHNKRYAVYFGNKTSNNTVSDNDFMFAESHLYDRPFDNGTNNLFISNYYENWDSQGSYNIQGFAESEDTSPLLNPNHLTPPMIISPTSETAILKDMVTIHWTKSIDSFNHPLSYSIFYSENSGITWIEISSGLTTLSLTWNVSSIANGTSIFLKVQVVDSLGYQSFSISDTSFIIESPVLITSSLPVSSSNQEYTSSSSIATKTTTTSVATPFLGIISIIMVIIILGLIRLGRNLGKLVK
jgi:parallel beta-helix repeat protein